MTEPNEDTLIADIVARLSATHPTIPASHVADVVRTAHAAFDGRPLRDFVPLFVERRATRQLATAGT